MTASASLVLLHGFLGAASSWDGVLAQVGAPRLADRVTPELLGHGADEQTGERDVCSFDDEIERLHEHLRRASPRTPTRRWLVGYSLGARLALGLAARADEPFERLVLVSGRDGLDDAEEARARAALDAALADTLVEDGLTRFVDRWEALPLFASQTALPEPVRASHRTRRLAHAPERVARALRTLSLGHMPRYAARAFARSGRVTLVVGEHDAKFRALAAGLAAAHGGEVRVVAGAGHDVVLERPEALAEILKGAT